MPDEIAKVLIVGSGVAAAAVAEKLLRADPSLSLLMLEAGGKIKMRDFGLYQNFLATRKLPQDSKDLYDSYTDLSYPDRDKAGENAATGDMYVPLSGSRMIAHGGSTSHWGGWSFRLKPEDFKLQSKDVGGSTLDWPFSYENLEPYYGQAEHFIGVSGSSKTSPVTMTTEYPFEHFPYTREDGPYMRAMDELKITYSHLPIARYGAGGAGSHHAPCQTTGMCKYCPFGARFAATNHLDELTEGGHYPNLKIRQHAVVERILMDSNTKVRGVEFLDRTTGQTVTAVADIVILAAGAIETPKLLLRSNDAGWDQGIGNRTDHVGRHLVSHPYFFFKADRANAERFIPQMGFPTLVSRYFDSTEEQKKGKFILVNPASSPRVDLNRALRKGDTVDKIKAGIDSKATFQMQGMVEVFSQRTNRVTNDKGKRTRFGMVSAAIHHDAPKGFEDRMRDIQKVVAEIFSKMGATNVSQEIPVSWRADHAACTTRMSKDASEGVVDPDLKVHDVSNLFICSNGVFPSLGAVNPTLTLTALALRLGDHLVTKI